LLGELIAKLEAIPKKTGDDEQDVVFSFGYMYPTGLSSWRGIYRELALEFTDERGGEKRPMKLGAFIEMLKDAVGKTYEGYKGGDYVMGKGTPVWVAKYGDAGNTGVVDVLDKDYEVILATAYCDC
jgi:murein DD-endopeptidase MepM/ murein hydrolase activator NlpD